MWRRTLAITLPVASRSESRTSQLCASPKTRRPSRRRGAPLRLRTELLQARRRMPDLVDPFRRRRAEVERGGAVLERHAERAAAGGDPRHLVEGNRQPEIAAAELEHVRFEARLAARRLALETRSARRFSSHFGPWSFVPGSWSVPGAWSVPGP